MAEADALVVAIRSWAVPRTTRSARLTRPSSAEQRLPKEMLLIDTETSVDAAQRLRFGVFRYVRRVEDADGTLTLVCVAEGLFYADDLPEADPVAFQVLTDYVQTHRRGAVDANACDARLILDVMSRTEFVERVVWRAAYELGATIVCFNLPFDLSRIAVHVGAARNAGKGSRFRFRDGFSFALWGDTDDDGRRREHPYRPRIQLKALDSKRCFAAFTSPSRVDSENRRHRGSFLDLRTLVYALTDEGHSLESAAAAFGVPFQKRKVEHGRITAEYIEYGREDVGATQAVLEAALREFARHPIDLPAVNAYSSASIGRSYLQAMGIRPVLERQLDFPPDLCGAAMSAYFGGRAEARIRRTPLPVAYCDFLSMYPTICILLGLWSLLIAERIEIVEATEEVRDLVANLEADDCYHAGLWKGLMGMALIDPNGATLPVRAAYAGGQNHQIGVNPLESRALVWYSLADILAACLLDPTHKPKIVRAIQLRPVGQQTLRSTRLLGEIEIEPGSDFFREVVQARQKVKADVSLPESERDARSRGLKVLANATAYGIYAQMIRQVLGADNEEIVDVYGLDGAFECRTSTPEDPGPFAFPPFAACLTGGARLMLALLEQEIRGRGGGYTLMDTDSCMIVATEHSGLVPCEGGTERMPDGRAAVRALSYAQVDKIRDQFDQLHPYDRTIVTAPMLELEDVHFVEGERVPLNCYAISAKRYALYRVANSCVTIVKGSEHGLGHLLNPLDPEDRGDAANPDDPKHKWTDEVWKYLIELELRLRPERPAWFGLPAIQRITVSNWTLYERFQQNGTAGASYAERIKPHNFLLSASPRALRGPAEGVTPIAPYERNPNEWLTADWIDRRTGNSIRITTEQFEGSARSGDVYVKTYGDVVEEYAVHPEPKSLAPDGGHCRRSTRGLLVRRPVTAKSLMYVGKEANELEAVEGGLITDVAEIRNEYRNIPREHDQLRATLNALSAREVARRIGLGHSAVSDFLSGRSSPRTANLAAYQRLASEISRAS